MVSAGRRARDLCTDQSVRVSAYLLPDQERTKHMGTGDPPHPELRWRAGTSPGASECQPPLPDSCHYVGTEAIPAPRSSRGQVLMEWPDRGHDKSKCAALWMGSKPFWDRPGAVRSPGFPTPHLNPRTTWEGWIVLSGSWAWGTDRLGRPLSTRWDPPRTWGPSDPLLALPALPLGTSFCPVGAPGDPREHHLRG